MRFSGLGSATSRAGLALCLVASVLLGSNTNAQPNYNLAYPLHPMGGDGTVELGASTAIYDDLLAVGAWRAPSQSTHGAVFLYDLESGAPLQVLTTDEPQATGGPIESIAIHGDTLLAGMWQQGPNLAGLGAVYVFDLTTGAQTAKLTGDRVDAQFFGNSVAMTSSVIAVGAPRDNDDKLYSGAVYLYDADTLQLIENMKSPNVNFSERFGESIDIIEGVGAQGVDLLVVGAPPLEHFLNPDSVGSVYVYDLATRTLLFTIDQPDGVELTDFGYTLSLSSNNLLAVGARNFPSPVEYRGRTYVYIADTGQLITTIDSPILGKQNFGQFGDIVAIEGSTVVVNQNFDSGLDPFFIDRVAHVFDAFTGTLLQTLEAPIPAGTESWFGFFQFDISGEPGAEYIAIGAPWEPAGPLSPGATYVFQGDALPDTDGDGLVDDWEENGIPYVDSMGGQQRYMLPNADPMHKDLYIEVDAMDGFEMSTAAITMLEEAFAAGNVSNPDGVAGVNIRIMQDDTDILHEPEWTTTDCWPDDFDLYRALYYGTSTERNDPDAEALLEAKAKAFRYCILADSSSPIEYGGCAPVPGDNFIVFKGSFLNDEQDAAAFMHELGHNLGLKHGGCDNINGKPNYPSVMNYVFGYRYPWNQEFWALDYSIAGPQILDPLDESSLNELAGLGSPNGLYYDYLMPYGYWGPDGNGNLLRRIGYVRLNGEPTDFGDLAGTGELDGMYNNGIEQDLNFAADAQGAPGLPATQSPGQVLLPHDDWANLQYKLLAAQGPGAPSGVIPANEPTIEDYEWVETNFPAPPLVCLADVNGDGALTPTDFTAWINAFNNNLPACDQNSDGSCTPTDFTAWIANFNAGCV